jgi:hypothetical protein
MRLKDVVRAKKTITDGGKVSTAKMPKTAFPMSKSNSVRLGSGWHWRLIEFTAHCKEADVGCRLLVAFHQGKQNYASYLGLIRNHDTLLLARYEFHSYHAYPGWHLHSKCVETSMLAPGVVKGPYVQRYPKCDKSHRRNSISLSPSDFLAPAFKTFGIDLT